MELIKKCFNKYVNWFIDKPISYNIVIHYSLAFLLYFISMRIIEMCYTYCYAL